MHTRFHLAAIAASLLLLSVMDNASAKLPGTPQEAVQQYVQAESKFELATLKAVLAPDFIEISPLGQVDDHDAVLSFYAPDKQVAGPAIQLSQIVVHDHGDTAVMTTQISYTMSGHTMTLTLGAVARHTAQGWHLLSAQYTTVRPNQPPATKP